MTDLWQKIKALLLKGSYRISDHALDEMLEDGILKEDMIVKAAHFMPSGVSRRMQIALQY